MVGTLSINFKSVSCVLFLLFFLFQIFMRIRDFRLLLTVLSLLLCFEVELSRIVALSSLGGSDFFHVLAPILLVKSIVKYGGTPLSLLFTEFQRPLPAIVPCDLVAQLVADDVVIPMLGQG